MPEEGLDWIKRQDLLSYEELQRIVCIFLKLGVNKIRITGGEPFVRRDLIHFMTQIACYTELQKLTLTTNGTIISPHLPMLKQIGVKDINLSLDSLKRDRFYAITRRDDFETVWNAMNEMLDFGFHVKLNVVVIDGINTDEVNSFVSLTKDLNIDVRFIEEMPFNGQGIIHSSHWNDKQILFEIKRKYPQLTKLKDPDYSTAIHYQVPGFRGKIGIIAAYSRNFCGTCNRLRLTTQGLLQTCLYSHGGIDLKAMLREGWPDEAIENAIKSAVNNRHKDGWEAEKEAFTMFPSHSSMAKIGG